MRNTDIEWLIGNEHVKVCPIQPYSDLAVDFLDEFAGVLRKKVARGTYSDILSLAFWCRKGNIMKLREEMISRGQSLGRGLIFHVTPSNVPVNFAFSYFFGVLAGNANIVRVPTKEYPQVDIICQVIRELLDKEEYKIFKEGTAFVRYERNKEITDWFSQMADGRIIWGGDDAVNSIRQSPMKPKSVEIVFADRYSFGVIDSDKVVQMSDAECVELAKKFYNDTYLMDQNACSTPHMIAWLGSATIAAKERFWNAVYAEAGKYDFEPIKAVDKYTDLCLLAMNEDKDAGSVKMWGNRLYTVELKKIPEDMSSLRGRFGMFYQIDLENINQLAPYITERVQSLLYYGIDKNELLDFVMNNHLIGIDRIVPFGKALDMTVFWDGYDIIGQLSRRIAVE